MVRGQTARERTVGHQENLPLGGPWKGGAPGHLLGKRRPPEIDPGPSSQKMGNAETDTKMLKLHDPSPVCSHLHPLFCLCSPGSAEAWFAMPALWITRRESATAHPAPRGETPRFSDRDPSRTGCSIPCDPSPWPLAALWSDQSCRLRQAALEWTDRRVEGGRSRGGSQERALSPHLPLMSWLALAEHQAFLLT